MSRIEFVGLVVRTADGQTRTLDLSGTDLELKVEVDIPAVDADVTEFGQEWTYLSTSDRVDVSIVGRRRAGAAQLCTTRRVDDGEPPFPAWERAE